MTTASGLMGTPDYLTWGVLSISVANLVVVAVMIVLFLAALLVPFPHGHDDPTPGDERDAVTAGPASGAGAR